MHPVAQRELIEHVEDGASLGIEGSDQLKREKRGRDPSLSATWRGSTQYPSASS